MAYYPLQLEQLPRLSADAFLAQGPIRWAQTQRPLEVAKRVQRVFLEAPQHDGAARMRSVYRDMRPSKRYPRIRVGVECFIEVSQSGGAEWLSVQGRAFGDNGQLGGETFLRDYAEARTLALSFVDYAGRWVDPLWFDELPLHPSEMEEIDIREAEEHLSVSASDDPMVRAAKAFLNSISSRLAERVASDDSKEQDPPAAAVESAESLVLALDQHIVGPGLTSQERASLWRRLIKETASTCHARGRNYSCTGTESELLVRQHLPLRELCVTIEDANIVVSDGQGREVFRVMKTAKGSFFFEAEDRISSIPQLAQRLLRLLIRAQIPERATP